MVQASKLQHLLKHFLQRWLNLSRLIWQIIEGHLLLHIAGLRHLQLHGMVALGRLAVVAGDVAASKAAIEHAGVAGRLLGDVQQLVGQSAVAGRAFAGAQIQVGQLAFKKAR